MIVGAGKFKAAGWAGNPGRVSYLGNQVGFKLQLDSKGRLQRELPVLGNFSLVSGGFHRSDKAHLQPEDKWLYSKSTDLNVNIITLEEEMATHCSILAWNIPWTEEPG